jgi:anthranilate phosphoribosyltransferase
MNPLISFGRLIQRLIQKSDLSSEEAYLAFCEILKGTQPDLHQGAFLAALVAKGETVGEIEGAWRAIMELDTVDASQGLPRPLIENSGTGMDSLKTFNVSSVAAIVAASCGATLARHGARALTSSCGTVDVLEALGIGVEVPVETIQASIRTCGLGLFNGMSAKVHPCALGRILSQIRFGSTLNIAASLANPARPDRVVRGVYAPRLMPLVAEVLQAIGVEQGMVVHGYDAILQGGMDELSITGPTEIISFTRNDRQAYTLKPEDVGLHTARFEEIAALGDVQAERDRLLAILSGKGTQACTEMTCLNAAAILFVGGLADSLEAGVQRSREAIADGRAIAKLQEWKSAVGSSSGQ